MCCLNACRIQCTPLARPRRERLDRFAGIAPQLYAQYGGRDDPQLREELRSIVRRFFVGGLDTLES